MLYQPTAEQVRKFTRDARRVERMMAKRGGTTMNPAFAAAKMREIIDSSLLRLTGELAAIRIPALARPTLADLQKHGVRRIERDSSPTGEVNFNLATILRAGEEGHISGSDYEARIAAHLGLVLGYQHRQWLIANQDEFPEFTALLGKVYIDFPGIVVVGAAVGGRYIPCASSSGERWNDYWLGLADDFNFDDRIGVSSK